MRTLLVLSVTASLSLIALPGCKKKPATTEASASSQATGTPHTDSARAPGGSARSAHDTHNMHGHAPSGHRHRMGARAVAARGVALATVAIPPKGKKFDPPVRAEQIPEGAWYCDMGSVHYARLEKGDGACPLCHMRLKRKGAK